jgi:hypothetical protein
MAVEAEAVPAVVAIRAAGDAPARSDALQPVRPPACVFLISGSAHFAAARCAQAGRSTAAAGGWGTSVLADAPLTWATIFASSSASLQSEHLPHTQNTAWRSGA